MCLHSPSELEKTLRGLPKTLDATYEQILMKLPKPELAYRVIMWLAFSTESHTLDEILTILAYDVDGLSLKTDLLLENTDDIFTMYLIEYRNIVLYKWFQFVRWTSSTQA